MSNAEASPEVVPCESTRSAPQLLLPRSVPLGGPRAQPVRRTLPQRARSLIGAWCFVDHYGPSTPSMAVPGHPHTGLQTVSWLFSGTIEHRDTVGTTSLVRAGEMNLMTAGRGIAHSEHATPDSDLLHGVQLWVALPDRDRFTAPRFEHHVPRPVLVGDTRLTVFLGSLMGSTSPVATSTPLLGAQLDVPAGARLDLTVDPAFEHGVLVDAGDVEVDGAPVTDAQLLYLPTGAPTLTITAGDRPARLLLLGGEPLDERIVMWWNFIGRTHDEVERFRAEWQAQIPEREGPYGTFPTEWSSALPAPELPNARLRPRD
ncbi:pirin family protein [Umezawaea endophytica]|uniref:Pirin family protein n=1 Tax=Umezawaea endophytica TaxID=1654476 RepID=A0A9X2VRA5_9PSEU|nr:pirin family protein [Umezawaea endophytica]MCS7480897.1 pirin family protein [Umezawaea endophytica]